MTDPLWKIQTIRYKTYLKEALVEALRNAFAAHPDALLARTKVDIDFPTDEADYPAVIVRFFERGIKNAGVAHQEWFEAFDIINRGPLYTDPYSAGDNSGSYEVYHGVYPSSGIFPVSGWIARPTIVNTSDRIESIVKIHWTGDPLHVGQLVKSDIWTGYGIYCVARFNEDSGKLKLELYIRRGSKGDELIVSQSVNVPDRNADYYILVRAIDDNVGLGIYTSNPVSGVGPIHQLNMTIPAVDMGTLAGKGNLWLEASSSNSSATSIIDQYSVNDLIATLARAFRRFKHVIYEGDIELAVYALTSYDRDLIADTLIEVLMMADLEPWTNELLKRIYNADINIKPTAAEHFININTDTIGPFGESQTPVPWGSEDELIYNVSYRIPVMGELYSRTPTQQVFGFVERVDTYPYMGDLGDPVPNPHPEDPSPWL